MEIVVLLMIWAFLLSYFKPELILSETTTSGGDLGSHNYLAKYMKESLEQGRLIGWSHDWYAGLPMFQFYFPLAYAMISILSVFINSNIAFKMITILGTFLMPLCAYFAFRILKFGFPLPIVAAVFTLPFLFLETNSMYGGNIPSTLAGEFSFSISMALSIVFIASLYSGIKTKKMLVFNIILLGAIALFHIVPIIAVALSSVFFLLKDTKNNLKYLAAVFLGSFLLVGFWSIPFLAKLDYTTSASYTALRQVKDMAPESFYGIFLLALVGSVFAYRKKDERIFYLALIFAISFVLFSLMPSGYVWNTRFLPWYYITAALIAAYGLGEMLSKVKQRFLVPIIVFVVVAALVSSSVAFIESWINWNYSGFESKPGWGIFKELNGYLDSLPYGKVLHEYSSKHDAVFGTPRALELIPYFTNKPGMEGLLIESSLSSPFYFYLQSEISETPTCPISTYKCGSFDIYKAAEHIELFNIKYLVASSEKLKSSLENSTKFKLLRKINETWVYELNRENTFVAPLKYKPVLAERSNWRNISYDWIKSNFSDVTIIYETRDSSLPFDKIKNIDEIKRISQKPCSVSEKINVQEEIILKTDCIGKPLLVKVTYSPNWQAEGAKIYLASPSFFAIIPEKSDVRIYYDKIWVDWLGIIATLSMVLFLINLKLRLVKI